MISAFEPVSPKAPSRLMTWRASAPASTHLFAQSTGSPKTVAVSLLPWTSWTHLPPRMSTAGKTVIAMSYRTIRSMGTTRMSLAPAFFRRGMSR